MMACVVCGMSGADDVEDSDDSAMEIVPSSLSIAKNLGVDAPHIQLQKASFFAANDDDDDDIDDDVRFGYIRHKGRLWAMLTDVKCCVYTIAYRYFDLIRLGYSATCEQFCSRCLMCFQLVLLGWCKIQAVGHWDSKWCHSALTLDLTKYRPIFKILSPSCSHKLIV